MTRASLSQIILSQIASPVPRVAAAIRAMPLIQKQWCLGGRALPFVPWTASSKVDLHEVTGEQDVDEARVLLLNFRATADMEWLSEHLKLPSRWWVFKSRKVPLLQELLKLIEAKNTGAKKAASTCKLVVSILLRDHVFLVLNDTRAPVLAFDAEEPNMASLEWFVNELASDIKYMDTTWRPSSGSLEKNSSSDTIEEEILAKDAVAKLKRHPFCLNAWYLPSRGSFKIQRTDKNYFEVGIPDVKKLQKNARMEIGDLAWQPFETTIIQTYTKSLEVLETNNALETKKPEETRPSQKQRLLTEWGARGSKE